MVINMAVIAKNPILPGFYPDPSICAVGEDFYLVNSTFAYFPGIPVMHSKDLAHWEQIGNVMERNSQLPLGECRHSQGLFAPTIRYHEGVYYMICTNVSYGGNFIVTATSPEGPWSEPYYIEGAAGIDPSLFFDEDGTCYYIGTHANPEGCKYDGDWYIWVQELDVKTMKLVGEPKDVWNGAMRNIIWPEGPHLYKRNGYYYILHAEGGTGPHHAVTVCRSKHIFGPYENNFCNPIITHRHLGKDYPVQYVGHADLVETVHGDWYMVMLAVRPEQGYTTLGRETFLAEVVWENDWPVVNPGKGILTQELEVKLDEWIPENNQGTTYDFTSMQKLGAEWLSLRNTTTKQSELVFGEGLYLYGNAHTLNENANPAYLGIRQCHHQCRMDATMTLDGLVQHDVAGLAVLQSNEYHAKLEVEKCANEYCAKVVLCQKEQEEVLGTYTFPIEKGQEVTLTAEIAHLKLKCTLSYGDQPKVVAQDVPVHTLSTEVAGGFVGSTLGVYTVSAQNAEESKLCIKKVTYKEV